jgi:hypothetical protein
LCYLRLPVSNVCDRNSACDPHGAIALAALIILSHNFVPVVTGLLSSLA